MDAAAIHACTAFAGTQRLAGGPVRDVARAVKTHLNAHPESQVLVFDNTSAQQTAAGGGARAAGRMTFASRYALDRFYARVILTSN